METLTVNRSEKLLADFIRVTNDTKTLLMNSNFTQRVLVIAGIIFSALCWYFSNGLRGDFWYLLWVAPIPVLIFSFNNTGKMAFIISFIAYLIGRLSYFLYLVQVATSIPAIIITLALTLVFAVVILFTRRAVIKANSWYAVFAFPVFFTTFEFLLIRFSADSTSASIAYSQSNFLPVIQIASVTGILGITFLVTFIPSAIAVGWHYRKEKNKLLYIMSVAVVIVASIFLFGVIRISNSSEKSTTKVGLAVMDEKLHNITRHPDFLKEKLVTAYYANQISNLAQQGAKVTVLPEKAININKESERGIITMLSNVAKQNHVFIIAGYTNFRNAQEYNSALVINADGKVLIDYNKVYLVKGWEDQFTAGNKIGVFKFTGTDAGTAICKDLDFPGYINKYGNANISFLNIPAWDFVIDDWLHSRMAILRGIENGFSEVRTARQGRLTISDCYGKITDEANCSDGKGVTLLGNVSLQKINTIYTRLGDWFGVVNLIAATGFVFFSSKKIRGNKLP